VTKKFTIEEIEKMLEGITWGEWQLWDGCSWRRFGQEGKSEPFIEPYVASDGHPDLSFRNHNDPGFICAAPQIIRQLLEDLENLQDRFNSIVGLNE